MSWRSALYKYVSVMFDPNAIAVAGIDFWLRATAGAKPPRPEEMSYLQTQLGGALPLVYGTCRVQSPPLIWNGQFEASLGSDGYTYHGNLLIDVGVPSWDEIGAPFHNWRATHPPRLMRLWYGDKENGGGRFNAGAGLGHDETPLTVVVAGAGSEELLCRLSFLDGRADQSLSGTDINGAMLAAGSDGTLIPGYRHQMLAQVIAHRGIGSFGASPQVRSFDFEVQSLGPQPIGEDANPAWVLYDLLCGKVWKLGLDPDDVDLDSFQAAADQLVFEQHGISIVFYQPEDASEVLQTVLAQINGLLFVNPATGKLTLKLVRAGDTSVLVFDTTNTIGRPKIMVTSWSSTKNHIQLGFTNRGRDYKPDKVQDGRMASALGRFDRQRTFERNFPGCASNTLAAKLAARELGAESRPLVAVTVTANREAYQVLPGDVVTANWPDLQITDKAMRVLAVDLGQLADGGIKLTLVEDVFDNPAGVADQPPDSVLDELDLVPLTEWHVIEAPYFWMYKAFVAGRISSLTDQYLMAFAVAEGEAIRFRLETRFGGALGFPVWTAANPYAEDVQTRLCPLTATVQTAYARTLDPYDTTTGLVIEDVHMGGINSIEGENYLEGLEAAGTIDPAEIGQGENMLIAFNGNGDHEFLSFESVTSLGGTPKRYRLNNVWRGLLDTAPIDLEVGARVYLVSVDAVGTRGWGTNVWVGYRAIPVNGPLAAPTDNEDRSIRIAKRKDRALRLADHRLTAYEAIGTKGLPAVSATYPMLGHFKSLASLDGAIDLLGRENEIAAGQVVRGDSTIWTIDSGSTFDVCALKDGEYTDGELEITGKTGLPSLPTTGVLIGEAGHGTIYVRCYTLQAGKRSWFPAWLRIEAPHYRDLLANGSFDYGAVTPGWTVSVGTVSVQTDTDSLSREATGSYLIATAAGGTGNRVIDQTVRVNGYRASHLRALATFYVKARNADVDDKAFIEIRAFGASGVDLGSSAGTVGGVGPTTHWRRYVDELDLPDGTEQIRVRVTLAPGPEDDNGYSDVAVTRVQLQVGQMTDELLTNPSFDGALTGWTAVSNSFVFNNTNGYASDDGTIGAAQGGAFSSSEIKQEIAIPSGYKYGKAVLTLARSTVGTLLDTGEVVLEVLDAGSMVLDSATTGAEYTAFYEWFRRRLVIDLPDDAVTLRVRLIANRISGSDNSGACFDDLSLRVWKDLDPQVTYDFDFGTPPRSAIPTTCAAFHIAYPELPIPSAIWGGSSITPSTRLSTIIPGVTHAWSDNLAHPAGKMYGYWTVNKSNVQTTDAYVFWRSAPGSAVDLRSTGGTTDEWGKYTTDSAFTVAVLLRADEIGAWQGACGILGRRDDSGIGWGLRVDASGHPEIIMQGSVGTFTAQAPDVISDGAPRWVVLRNDPVTNQFTIYTRSGSSSFSPDVEVGDISVASAPFRIGRDSPASQTFPGMIGRVIIWDEVLTFAQIEKFTKAIGKDPNDLLTDVNAWTSSQAVYVPGPDNADGETLIRYAGNMIPIGYSSALDADGDGYGVVTTQANTNRIPSFDFSDPTKWGPESNDPARVEITQHVVDPTGLPRGVLVEVNTAGFGLRLNDIPMTPASTWTLLFYARSPDSIPADIRIELLDSDGNAISNATMSNVTGSWARFEAQLTWNNATPTASLRFVTATGTTGTFELGHVSWLGATAVDYPIAIQDAGLAIGNTFGVKTGTLDRRYSHDGEIYIEGVCRETGLTRGPAIASLDNDSDNKDRRLVTIESGPTAASFLLYNASGTPTPVEAAINWSEVFEIRARWNSLELPDNPGNQQGIRCDDGSLASTYTANAYTISTTPLAAMRIGGKDEGAAASSADASHNMFLRRIVFRTREEKIFSPYTAT